MRVEKNNPTATKDRLKVLVLDGAPAFPPDSGRRVRTWNLLRRLAARHHLTYLCHAEPRELGCDRLRALGIRVVTVDPLPEVRGSRLYLDLLANTFSSLPYAVAKHTTRRYQARLRELLAAESFDLVHCEATQYAGYLRVVRDVPTVLATHNIESQIWFRRSAQARNPLARLFFGWQALRMKWFERRAMRRSDWVTVCTHLEAEQAFDWHVPAVSVVENGVDLDDFVPSAEPVNENEMVFVGSLDWYPNQDAVRYFAREILPLIRARVPSAVFRVVGRRPPASLTAEVAGLPGVDLIGEVDDVRPHFARAAVAVVPLRIGGGSRIKIVEALAMGKAVVSTTVGAEGLSIYEGEHLMLADSPELFATRTLALLSRAPERHRLGKNGRNLAIERYSWRRAADATEEAWLNAALLRPVPVRQERKAAA